MQAITGFVSHYITTYQAYLASSIIWQVLVTYIVVVTTGILLLNKYNKFQYFFHFLISTVTAASVVCTYTFWSLW